MEEFIKVIENLYFGRIFGSSLENGLGEEVFSWGWILGRRLLEKI